MPENINQADVQRTLAEKIENQEALQNSTELRDIALAEGSIQVLRQIINREDGEDESEHAAEQAALSTAIEETATAHEAEGVTPTLIRMWIHGEEIGNSLDELGELNVESYAQILASPEATEIVQNIARQLEIEIGDGGENEDGVDGKYGALTAEAVGKIQEALIKAGLLPENMENGSRNQDGKFGKRTLAALRSAVTTEAAAEAVDEAAAAAPVDGAAPAVVDGPAVAVETTPETPEEEITMFVERLPGMSIEGQNMRHFNDSEPIPISDYIVDGTADLTGLTTSYHEANQAFATSNGVEYRQSAGETDSGFDFEDRSVSVEDLLNSPDIEGNTPAERLENWKNTEDVADPESGEIPANHIGIIRQQVGNIIGVKSVGENDSQNTVTLFDGSTMDLNEIYESTGGDISALQRYALVRDRINQSAEEVATRQGLTFTPEVTDPFFRPAEFLQDGEAIFYLKELTDQSLDSNLTALINNPDRESIFQEALDGIRSEG